MKQAFETKNPSMPEDLARSIHNVMQCKAQKMQEEVNSEFKKIKKFLEIQSELSEFRLFLSLHTDKEEMRKIADKVRRNRKNLWAYLLKSNNGDEKIARDFFYE